MNLLSFSDLSWLSTPAARFGLALMGLLLIASLAGLIMRARLKGRPSPGLDNYQARVLAWWWMCFFIAGALLGGATATLILFAFASLMGLREFLSLTPTKPADYWPLVLAFYVAIPAQYALIAIDWTVMSFIFIPVWLFALISAASALSADTSEFLERNARVQFAIMACVYGVSHAPALLNLRSGGPLLLLFFIFVVQISDVLQYVFGKLFGRHLLIPKVSPSKTVEGLLFGGLSAALVGAGVSWLTPFSAWVCFLLSLQIVAAGFLGGLVMSAVKRSLGAKDWGDSIRGHGGFMDRLDSLGFAAPLFYHTVRWIWG